MNEVKSAFAMILYMIAKLSRLNAFAGRGGNPIHTPTLSLLKAFLDLNHLSRSLLRCFGLAFGYR